MSHTADFMSQTEDLRVLLAKLTHLKEPTDNNRHSPRDKHKTQQPDDSGAGRSKKTPSTKHENGHNIILPKGPKSGGGTSNAERADDKQRTKEKRQQQQKKNDLHTYRDHEHHGGR